MAPSCISWPAQALAGRQSGPWRSLPPTASTRSSTICSRAAWRSRPSMRDHRGRTSVELRSFEMSASHGPATRPTRSSRFLSGKVEAQHDNRASSRTTGAPETYSISLAIGMLTFDRSRAVGLARFRSGVLEQPIDQWRVRSTRRPQADLNWRTSRGQSGPANNNGSGGR